MSESRITQIKGLHGLEYVVVLNLRSQNVTAKDEFESLRYHFDTSEKSQNHRLRRLEDFAD